MRPNAEREPHWSATLVVAALAIVLWALSTGNAQATHDQDVMTEHVASNELGEMHYLEFVPEGLAPGSPVFVHLHGANNAVADAAHRSRLNTLARERGFVAVYPQEDPDNGNNGIWNSDQAAIEGRDGRAVSLVAQITNEVIERHDAGRRFVFLGGISAGAGMAGSVIGWYPDLFTGVQVEVSVVFGGGENDATTAGHQLVAAMGEHARRIPMVLSYGTADPIAM